MPIVGVLCPCSPGKVMPLDHWEEWAEPQCGAIANPLVVPMPLGVAKAIMYDKLGDMRHRDLNVTVTRTLDCPRKAIVEDLFDYALDVETVHNLFIGTMWHAIAYEEGEEEGFEGIEICGVVMSGTADKVVRRRIIEDGKFHGDRSMEFKIKFNNLVDDTLTGQLNMYKIGLEKKWEAPGSITLLIGRHGAMTTAGRSAYVPVQVPLRDEGWCRTVRPKGGLYTTEQIGGMWKGVRAAQAAGLSKEEVLAQVPLVGSSMFPDKKTGKGKMCDLYCAKPIKEICDRCARGSAGEDAWK